MNIAAPPTLRLPEDSVKDYWAVLARRRWIIILFCILCTGMVVFFGVFTQPLYQASVTLMLDNEDSNVLNPSGDNSKGLSFDIFENYLQTQMAIILSRNVAGRVFVDLGLAKAPRYQGETHPVKIFMAEKTAQGLSFLGLRNGVEVKPDSFGLFFKDIQLERLKGTRAIRISVLYPEPVMAARIANALAEKYSRDNLLRRATTFIGNQRMSSLNADYLRLQSKYDSLANLYGPKHPDMIKVKDEIGALARRIQEERKNTGPGGPLLKSPAGDISAAEEEKLLDDILNHIQESSVFSSNQMRNIQIVEPAVPPAQPSVPHKMRDGLIAFFASLVAGIFLAFFVEYLDDTLKNEEDLKKVIGGANFMGVVPFDQHVKGFRRLSRVDFLVTQRPLSGSAEAYRLLRIQLSWFMKKKLDFKDFAVVSSVPDEGKSTISSNMALALAQLNQKILLVDADIRRGRLSRTYNAGNKKGLSHYLSDNLTLDEVVQPTKIPNLWIVAPGENMVKGADLLSSSRMSDFIAETRSQFDLIVYDTPPITLIADTAVLLSQLHGAILVTRTGVTGSRIVPKAIKMIQDTNADLIGVVLNGAHAADNKYYNRYYKD